METNASRLVGSRSRLVKALAIAAVEGKDPQLVDRFKRHANKLKAPVSQVKELESYLTELTRTWKQLPSSAVHIQSQEEDNITDFLKGLPEEEEPNPFDEADSSGFLIQEIRKLVQDYLLAKTFKPLWKPVEIQGQKMVLTATWELRGPNCLLNRAKEPLSWNLNGGFVGSKFQTFRDCGEDIRVFDGGRAICVNKDVEEVNVVVGKAMTDSILPVGSQYLMKARIFVWALKYQKGRTFRFWVSETSTSGGRRDIWKWSPVMT